jgi:hypothetical protein
MNWKTLLVIASLSLTTGLTACSSKDAEAPKTDTTAPAATTETKPATEAPKSDTKPADSMKAPDAAGKTTAPKTDAKPAAGGKTDAKPAETKKP